MDYEQLLIEADNTNVKVKEVPLLSSKGRCDGDRIAINKKLRTKSEKACVLAEELGHYHTTVGNILNQSSSAETKQEKAARIWAYNKLIGLQGIINAYKHGCKDRYETAQYLGVTEDFLEEAIEYYHSKYGICMTLDNYIVYFEPALGVADCNIPY